MRFAPLVLATACILVLFLGLDRVGFTDAREARDARVARELIRRREVLTPLLGVEPHFEKPVLAYVPEVLAHLAPPATPVSPLRSRLLRAVAAVALILLTASIGAQHFGARAGWCSAIVLATSLGVPLTARTDGTQVLGTLLAWVGCAGLADAVFGRAAGRDLRLVVTYGALAAALVVAGPLPALWPIAGLALYARLAHDREGFRHARPIAGLLVMAGIGLPWYGAMIERFGAPFLAHAPFFPYATEPRGFWLMGPFFALSFLVVGFFPWSALLPEATLHAATWWRFARRRRGAGAGGNPAVPPVPLVRERREEGAAHFFIACLLAALVPVVLYPGPPLTAVLAALPAAALLCGRVLDHLIEDPERMARPIARAAGMLALVGSVGGILLAVAAGRVREAAPELRLLGSLVFATAWAPFLAEFMGRRRLAAALMLLPVALGTPVLALRLMPAMEGYLNARAVALTMNRVSPALAPLVLIEPPPPSLRLYAERNLVVASSLPAALDTWRADDGLTYLAFAPSHERDVDRGARATLEIVLRSPSLVLARVPSPAADSTAQGAAEVGQDRH